MLVQSSWRRVRALEFVPGHVDIRYHFVREHVVDDLIKIVFVKSCDNDADLFTKNVRKDTYTKHMKNFLGKTEDSNK